MLNLGRQVSNRLCRVTALPRATDPKESWESCVKDVTITDHRPKFLGTSVFSLIVSSQLTNRNRQCSATSSAAWVKTSTGTGTVHPHPCPAQTKLTRLIPPNARFSSGKGLQYPQRSFGPKYSSWLMNPNPSPSSDHRWSSEDPCPENDSIENWHRARVQPLSSILLLKSGQASSNASASPSVVRQSCPGWASWLA